MSTKARAIHFKSSDCEGVVIGSLRVIVSEQQGYWFAQGIEIDFAASGSSLDDVQERFEHGLVETISAHLSKYGTIEKLLKYAPKSEWQGLTGSKEYFVDMVSVHELQDQVATTELPFKQIAYLEKRAAA